MSEPISPVVRLVEKSVQDHLEVFRSIAFESIKDTLLPELFSVFGSKAAIKFMDVFAGSSVEVPSRKILDDLVRTTDIYVMVENGRPLAVIAEKYDTDVPEVKNTYARAKKLIESFKNGRLAK